jgi:hypothetical protein
MVPIKKAVASIQSLVAVLTISWKRKDWTIKVVLVMSLHMVVVLMTLAQLEDQILLVVVV